MQILFGASSPVRMSHLQSNTAGTPTTLFNNSYTQAAGRHLRVARQYAGILAQDVMEYGGYGLPSQVASVPQEQRQTMDTLYWKARTAIAKFSATEPVESSGWDTLNKMHQDGNALREWGPKIDERRGLDSEEKIDALEKHRIGVIHSHINAGFRAGKEYPLFNELKEPFQDLNHTAETKKTPSERTDTPTQQYAKWRLGLLGGQMDQSLASVGKLKRRPSTVGREEDFQRRLESVSGKCD